jgi:DNA-binding NarL/FixJ family response regulator
MDNNESYIPIITIDHKQILDIVRSRNVAKRERNPTKAANARRRLVKYAERFYLIDRLLLDGQSQTQIARRLGISTQRVSKLLDDHK